MDSVECSFITLQCFYHEICAIACEWSVGQPKENGGKIQSVQYSFKHDRVRK